jgi:hypothetical protein
VIRLVPVFIRVDQRLSRSNVRFSGVVRVISHQELAAVIGTGFVNRDSSPAIFESAFIRVYLRLIRFFDCCRRPSAFIGG